MSESPVRMPHSTGQTANHRAQALPGKTSAAADDKNTPAGFFVDLMQALTDSPELTDCPPISPELDLHSVSSTEAATAAMGWLTAPANPMPALVELGMLQVTPLLQQAAAIDNFPPEDSAPVTLYNSGEGEANGPAIGTQNPANQKHPLPSGMAWQPPATTQVTPPPDATANAHADRQVHFDLSPDKPGMTSPMLTDPMRSTTSIAGISSPAPETTQSQKTIADTRATTLHEAVPVVMPSDRQSTDLSGSMEALAGYRYATETRIEPSTLYQATLRSPPETAGFKNELASEVRMLMRVGLQHAELRMNPMELGPVFIEMRVSSQTADITFTALHAATRDGITQSLPQLRDMLNDQGLSLGQTSVGAHTNHQPQRFDDGNAQKPHWSAPHANGKDETGWVESAGLVHAPRGVLDLYA